MSASQSWLFLPLRFFCPPHLLEEIEGDLMQRYERDVQAVGEKRANRRLAWNTVRYFRPGILLRNKLSIHPVNTSMIKRNFSVAFRHLMKGKTFTLLNVVGLTTGFTAFYFILQYLNFELSFDRFYKNRIYRITYEQTENREVVKSSAATFWGVGDFLLEHFGQDVKEVVRFYKWPANTGAVLMVGSKIFNERNYFFAERSLFKVFDGILERGDVNTCLASPNSIVLSKNLAYKMFGDENPMGKLVKRLDVEDTWLEVTGIMKDLPPNSHFDLDVVIPYDKDWIPDEVNSWGFSNNNLTYILLSQTTDASDLQGRLNSAIEREQKDNPAIKGVKNILQPIEKIHFSSYQDHELKVNANERVLAGIGIAAVVILLIALINYVNLEVSRFFTRVKEVGVRRVIGSTTWQLVQQFSIQFLCLAIFAAALTVVCIWFISPIYTKFLETELLPFSEVMIWPTVIAVSIFMVGIVVAGLYPAFYLTGFHPIACLKGKLSTSTSGVKKGLLAFQLIASLILLSFLFVVWSQLNFMRSSQRNVDVNQVLTIYNSTSYSIFDDSLKKERSQTFRNMLLRNPGILNVSCSSVIPGEPVGFTYHNLTKRSLNDPDDNVPYKVIFVDYYYIPVYSVPMIAGRNYSEESGEDNNLNSLILNESAVKSLAFPSAEEAINKEVYFMVGDDWKKYKIIGVTEDYSHESVKIPIYPTIFFLHKYIGQMTYYSIQTSKGANIEKVLSDTEKIWKKQWPEKPFDYAFADQKYDKQYQAEIVLSRVFMVFAAVAVFLACIGVLGITISEISTRLREISIRKVLGATALGLIRLLSKDLAMILALASCLAIPGSYLLATQWLSTYQVQVEITPVLFLVPLFFVLLLVFSVSIINTLRASNTNPVNHLRNE